jgi:hypothetical protein
MMLRALESPERAHTLLVGPPACAKSLFMLEIEVNRSYNRSVFRSSKCSYIVLASKTAGTPKMVKGQETGGILRCFAIFISNEI